MLNSSTSEVLLEPGCRDLYSAISIFVPDILHEAVLRYLNKERL